MINRINGELANDLGNLAQRVLTMANRNCGGALPEPDANNADDKALLDQARALHGEVAASMNVQAFNVALDAVWILVRAANAYVDKQAPWNLRKDNPARMGAVLYTVAETLRHIAIVLSPFMPQAMDRMLDQLGVAPGARDFAALAKPLQPGTALPPPQGVFPRLVEAEASADAGR
jgi:methionyl-tRNA synthetase